MFLGEMLEALLVMLFLREVIGYLVRVVVSLLGILLLVALGGTIIALRLGESLGHAFPRVVLEVHL